MSRCKRVFYIKCVRVVKHRGTTTRHFVWKHEVPGSIPSVGELNFSDFIDGRGDLSVVPAFSKIKVANVGIALKSNAPRIPSKPRQRDQIKQPKLKRNSRRMRNEK